MKKTWKTVTAAAILGGVIIMGSGSTRAGFPPRATSPRDAPPRVAERRVHLSGYTLRAFKYRRQNVRVFTFEGGQGLGLRVLPAKHYRGILSPSIIGTRRSAVAATNGQFRIPGTYRPRPRTVANGNLLARGDDTGWHLSIAEDDRRALVSRAPVSWAHQVMGGWPQVVDSGVNTGNDFAYDGERCKKFPDGQCQDAAVTNYNPRTAIGITKGCTGPGTCQYLLVTIDGRQPPDPHGLRFPALGALMISLGAYDAINLDGGGSTVMWTARRNKHCVKFLKAGCLLNRSSAQEGVGKDGQRSVIDAIGVMPT